MDQRRIDETAKMLDLELDESMIPKGGMKKSDEEAIALLQ